MVLLEPLQLAVDVDTLYTHTTILHHLLSISCTMTIHGLGSVISDNDYPWPRECVISDNDYPWPRECVISDNDYPWPRECDK